jgi:LPXTG-motif cell wall-anchored protein
VRRPAPAETASCSSRLPRLALPAVLGAAIAALIGLLVLRRRRS